jgi:hypothetical protein
VASTLKTGGQLPSDDKLVDAVASGGELVTVIEVRTFGSTVSLLVATSSQPCGMRAFITEMGDMAHFAGRVRMRNTCNLAVSNNLPWLHRSGL